MATGWQTFPIRATGGLVSNLGVLEQGTQMPGSAISLQNFEPSIDGGYSKIKGFTKFSESAVGGSGSLLGAIPISATEVIAYKGNTVYRSTGTTWTSVGSATTGGAINISFDYFNFDGTPKVVIVDGVNQPLIYDTLTNTLTEDTTAPIDADGATYVTSFKNHLFFSKGSTIAFTAPFDELDYAPGNGAGVINVGSDIVGTVVFRDQLIIFSIDKIQRIVGSSISDFQLLPISEKTGCIDGKSIQLVGGDVVYLGPDGVRRLSATDRNDDFALNRVSEAIQRDVVNMVTSSNEYPSIVIRGKNQYRIFNYSAGGQANSAIGYLTTQFADQSAAEFQWARIKGFKVRQAASKRFSSSELIVFVTGDDNDYVYQMESGDSFDGEDITCIFQTPYMPITDPQLRKTIYKHTAYMDVNGVLNLTLQLLFDYDQSTVIQPVPIDFQNTGAGVAVFGDVFFGSASFGTVPDTIFKTPTIGSGFTVSLRYEETSSNPSFTIDTIILEFKEHDRK